MSNGYKELYTRINIVHELLVNRYMLMIVFNNLNEILNHLERKEKIVIKSLTKEQLKEYKQIKITTGYTKFENFMITNKQYNGLIKEYGFEITSNACVLLDKLIAKTGRTFKNPYKKLKEWGINLAMKERISEYTDNIIRAATQVDYKIIEDRQKAIQYIMGTPYYLRSVDEGCKYLRDKFNIQEI